MRGLRSTIAMLVVLIGLGAYAYFVTSKKTDDTASKQEKLFASLEAPKIDELKVKSKSGDVTTLKKENGAWKIVSPIAAPAAETDATGIANALADIDVTRVVEENPTDLKEYGLDAPKIEVDFKSSEGKTSGRLLVGESTATGGSLYARRDDQKRVVLIGQYHETTLNKSTFDLRDKAIVKFDRTKADGVDVNADGKVIEFAKADADWKITKPLAARADFSAVEGLLGRVETIQMKSVVTAEPTPADLKKYGLDKPSVTVNVHLGSARATLLVGGKADEGTVYVRDSAKPDVFTVEKSAADDFKKPVDDYRKKDVFDFRAFNATRVEITRNGQTLTLERVKATAEGSPDTWKRVSPAAGEPDRTKVETFLAGLADVRAITFVDSKAQTGLGTPAMTVVATFDDGKKEERVTFGKNGSEVYAARTDDPGAARIEAEKFDEATKAFDELSK
jgi:hypothetical protein